MATYGSIQGYDTMKGFNAPGDGDSLGGLDPGISRFQAVLGYQKNQGNTS